MVMMSEKFPNKCKQKSVGFFATLEPSANTLEGKGKQSFSTTAPNTTGSPTQLLLQKSDGTMLLLIVFTTRFSSKNNIQNQNCNTLIYNKLDDWDAKQIWKLEFDLLHRISTNMGFAIWCYLSQLDFDRTTGKELLAAGNWRAVVPSPKLKPVLLLI